MLAHWYQLFCLEYYQQCFDQTFFEELLIRFNPKTWSLLMVVQMLIPHLIPDQQVWIMVPLASPCLRQLPMTSFLDAACLFNCKLKKCVPKYINSIKSIWHGTSLPSLLYHFCLFRSQYYPIGVPYCPQDC